MCRKWEAGHAPNRGLMGPLQVGRTLSISKGEENAAFRNCPSELSEGQAAEDCALADSCLVAFRRTSHSIEDGYVSSGTTRWPVGAC